MEDLMQSMLRDLAGRGIAQDRALQALRALSKWFGGQLLYIPKNKDRSGIGQEIFGVFADAVGDSDAEKIYDIIASFYGGIQWYVPLERKAFKGEIAREIAEAYNGTSECLRDLCRKYDMSFNQIYTLLHQGRNAERQKEFIF